MLSYFAAFKERTLDRFWFAFEEYEVNETVKHFVNGGKRLADLTPSELYQLLSKTMAFKNPAVLELFSSKPLKPPSSDWPLSLPAPGVLLLAVHVDDDVREWALDRMKEADRNSQKVLNANHRSAVQVLVSRLFSVDIELSPLSKALSEDVLLAFPFTSSLYNLWTALAYFVATLPYNALVSLELSRLVIGHLHDNDNRKYC